jgi:Na+/phosphate symporter
MNNGYKWLVPNRGQEWINRRFEQLPPDERDSANFDLIRGTVNLIVASLLIALGTSMKLPLSTTYVTFMVAMGTSLADRAWGRETAVYRISGVVMVIMGWFVTGLGAFVIAFSIGMALMYGKAVAVIAISSLALFLIVRSNLLAKKKNLDESVADTYVAAGGEKEILRQCTEEVSEVMDRVTEIYTRTMVATMKENRKALRDLVRESNDLFYRSRERKYAMMPVLNKLKGSDIETVHYYVQVVDYLSEVTKSLVHITRPAFDHIDNNHKGFSKEQAQDLMAVNDNVKKLYDKINGMLETNDFGDMDKVMTGRDKLMEMIGDVIKRQLRRIQGEKGGTKTSVLFLNILSETKTMVLQSRNLLKSQKYFVASGQ